MVQIIAISGGSCSGKTTLAVALAARLGASECLLMGQDAYYFAMDTLDYDEALPNFDDPVTVNFDWLVRDLTRLKSGHSICPPVYDFAAHKHIDSDVMAEPRPIIIVEGILILTDPGLRAIADHSYFLECPEDVRFKRRLARDMSDRGREEAEIRWQFETHVAPCHDKFVEPSKIHADHVISQDTYTQDLDELCQQMIANWT